MLLHDAAAAAAAAAAVTIMVVSALAWTYHASEIDMYRLPLPMLDIIYVLSRYCKRKGLF